MNLQLIFHGIHYNTQNITLGRYEISFTTRIHLLLTATYFLFTHDSIEGQEISFFSDNPSSTVIEPTLGSAINIYFSRIPQAPEFLINIPGTVSDHLLHKTSFTHSHFWSYLRMLSSTDRYKSQEHASGSIAIPLFLLRQDQYFFFHKFLVY